MKDKLKVSVQESLQEVFKKFMKSHHLIQTRCNDTVWVYMHLLEIIVVDYMIAS